MNMAPSLEMRRRFALLGAHLSAKQHTHVLWEAGNTALTDEKLVEQEQVYVSEYLGILFGLAAEREAAGEILRGELPDDEAQTSSLGEMAFIGKQEMRIRYGDSQLAGTDSPLSPVDLEAAIYAREAVEKVYGYLGAAVLGE